MQINFRIYENLHEFHLKRVIRRENVIGVGLSLQGLRMGLEAGRLRSEHGLGEDWFPASCWEGVDFSEELPVPLSFNPFTHDFNHC